MEKDLAPQALPDDDLLRRVIALVGQSRVAEAEIVAHIAEVDARRLYAREACSSMFSYCTERLHFSEAEAYLRIAAARASRQHPSLLAMLADGRLHLSAIERLAPHLTPENRDAVLARAAHRTKRQVEELVAELAPRPDVPTLVRRLPAHASQAGDDLRAERAGAPSPAAVGRTAGPDVPGSVGSEGDQSSAAGGAVSLDGVGSPLPASGPAADADASTAFLTVPTRLRLDGVGTAARPAAVNRAVVEPTAPGRYKVQFTAGAELREKLERLQALMRRTAPDADLASIIEQAVSEKLERLEAARYAKVKKPRAAAPATPAEVTPRKTAARRIPAAIRRAVYARDDGRCRYTDSEGRRCTARHDLEFHHRHPFGHGGAHTVANLALVCAAHNRMLGESDYGRPARTAGSAPPPRSCPAP